MSPGTTFTKNDAVPPDATFDSSNVRGKSIIITGGASGIGEASMRAFVQAGAFVTFGDISEEKGQRLVAELGEDKVAFVHCDVLFFSSQLSLFKTALSRSPPHTIDIVLANAGIGARDEVFNQDATQLTADGIEEPLEPDISTLQVNIIGVAYTVKLALFYLPKQPTSSGRDRCLIITGSLASYLDHLGHPQYNASKMAVRGMMKSLRHSMPKEGMRVNLLAPWVIATNIVSESIKAKLEERQVPFAEVESAADAVMHLACDERINGRALAVVPKSFDKRGYYDLKQDDWDEENPLTAIQFRTTAGVKTQSSQ